MNTIDNTLTLPDNKLRYARNVLYESTGEVRSLHGLEQLGDNIVVNSKQCVKVLGGVNFQDTFYIMAANDTEARLMFYNKTNELWEQANAQNFDKDATVKLIVYQNKIWFVNGLTTSSNVLHFLSDTHTLTGLTTTTGLESGINKITLHLERVWISKGNKIFISKQYPVGNTNDWDAGSVYTGSNTAGLIQLDDNTEDEILQMVTQFGQLVVFRRESIHVISGQTILNSTIQKAFNAKGVYAADSISRADASIYFLSSEGVKVFSGNTVIETKTEFDNISTITIDRDIQPTIDAISNRSELIGFSFRDKYYLGSASNIFIYDEVTKGWSMIDVTGADLFLEERNKLYVFKNNKCYEFDKESDTEFESEITTKDYTFDYNTVQKCFEKVIAYFRKTGKGNDVTISWFIDGGAGRSGSAEKHIPSSAVTWDGEYTWGGLVTWSGTSINFEKMKVSRKLRSGLSISFRVTATGENRFFLSSMEVIFDLLKREVA
jgi:hypothetical protein